MFDPIQADKCLLAPGELDVHFKSDNVSDCNLNLVDVERLNPRLNQFIGSFF